MTDQRDKTSNGTQNPIPRTATARELLAVKNHLSQRASPEAESAEKMHESFRKW